MDSNDKNLYKKFLKGIDMVGGVKGIYGGKKRQSVASKGGGVCLENAKESKRLKDDESQVPDPEKKKRGRKKKIKA
jgi:hypothetical protein